MAERMICRMDDPITTKMKKPSMTGPTAKPYLDFSLALMSTRPRLWMFLWNLAEEAAKTRLEAACHGNTDGGARVSHMNSNGRRVSMATRVNTRGGDAGLGPPARNTWCRRS